MAKLLRVVPLLPALCVLGACAPHYSDVRPTASGPHTVVIPIKSKGDGFAYSMAQARFYCQEVQKKNAVVVKEDTKYVGSMDEKTYNTAKNLTEVTAAAGFLGGGFAPNKKNVDNSLMVGSGGSIAYDAIGVGYQYTLVFNCQ